MKLPSPWVAPAAKIPAAIRPLIATQRKHYGFVLNPARWWARMPGLFWLVALFVGTLERRRANLNPVLRALVMTRVSQLCHCAFCIDANGLNLAKRSGSMDLVHAVSQWRESALFTQEQRLALAYAEAMTATPPQVDDELKVALKASYSDQQLAELTALVAFQNLSARFNSALDIPAQGLCEIPQGDKTDA